MMTKQEIFDTAAAGLKSQGFVQSREADKCLYNGRQNNGAVAHCAFGWLITDVPLSVGHNAHSASDLLVGKGFRHLGLAARFGVKLKDDNLERETTEDEYNDPMVRFISSLQLCHDRWMTPEGMLGRLRRFAVENDLSDAILDGAEAAIAPPT